MKTTLLPLSLLLIFASCLPGQTCSGNQDFYGAYLFSAASPAFQPDSTVTPPSVQFSDTALGRTLKSILGQTRFATNGRLIADGLGTILAAPADADTIITRVGVYRVNGDCTMSLTLFDGFITGIDFFGNALRRGSVSFEGVLQDRGSEAVFVQTGATWPATLTLSRPYLAQGCTNNALSGAFGLAGSGIRISTKPATDETPAETVISPVSLLGRFVADGAGGLRPDTPGLESAQPKRQITGTYKVEADCTGVARILIDNQTYNLNFILLRGGVQFGEFGRSSIRFAFADAGVVGSGSGR